ncbi:histone deacetylase family protein [Alphaproteobacteria bacterium KMM 3653]|uniref:Histone deacetylase family protein n=1 Tax=Harenicola maris TaxID=2841044 RepID=A0AAP2G7U2_9RHOB|nr:histone deacetylase family protein [Harenicola maris]
MTTALFHHPDCALHETPAGHPERVERIEAVMTVLDTAAFAALERRAAPLAARAALRLAHPESHIEAIEKASPESGWVSLDGDTHMMPATLTAALRGAGACVAAVDAVLDGAVQNAFCAIRPPGHHAERETPMGFCLFSNAAIAVKHALEVRGLSRVALLDFDVHHGNGSQDVLWSEERALFISSHQSPLYPGTGAAHETGAANNIVNLPLPGGAGSAPFRAIWEREGFPMLERFKPELVVISAGFDAHKDDPLAQMNLSAEDFAWITHAICDIADTHAGGRVVSTLEGGYDLEGLAQSCAAHVTAFMERGAR